MEKPIKICGSWRSTLETLSQLYRIDSFGREQGYHFWRFRVVTPVSRKTKKLGKINNRTEAFLTLLLLLFSLVSWLADLKVNRYDSSNWYAYGWRKNYFRRIRCQKNIICKWRNRLEVWFTINIIINLVAIAGGVQWLSVNHVIFHFIDGSKSALTLMNQVLVTPAFNAPRKEKLRKNIQNGRACLLKIL